MNAPKAEKIFERCFRNRFSVTKTLCFGLEPVWESRENIDRLGIIDVDNGINAALVALAGMEDEFHREFISRALKAVQAAAPGFWAEACAARLVSTKEKGRWNAAFLQGCALLDAAFGAQPEYKYIFAATPSELIGNVLLPRHAGDKDKTAALKMIANKATYATGQHQQRAFLYTSTKKNFIKHRVLVENLKTYAVNCELFKHCKENIPEVIEQMAVDPDGPGMTAGALAAYFDPDNYGSFLEQEDITLYNTLINGYSTEDRHVKGLRNIVNEWAQKSKAKKKEIPQFRGLGKQIFSASLTLSHIPHQFRSDEEAYASIGAFVGEMRRWNVIGICTEVLSRLGDYDANAVTICRRDLPDIAKHAYGDWKALDKAMTEYAGRTIRQKARREKYLASARFSLADIESAVAGVPELAEGGTVTEFIAAQFRKQAAAAKEALAALENICAQKKGLLEGKEDNPALKTALHMLKDGQRTLALLMPTEKEYEAAKGEALTDDSLEDDLRVAYETYSAITPLLNAVRNRCTAKVYTTEKVRLRFGSPEFLGGWSLGGNGYSNIQTKGAMLLHEGEHHYLAVINNHLDRKEKFRVKDFLKQEPDGGMTMTEMSKLDLSTQLSQMMRAEAAGRKLGCDDWTAVMISDERYKDKNLPMEDLHRFIGVVIPLLRRHPSFGFPAMRAFLEKAVAQDYDSWTAFVEAAQEHAYSVSEKAVSKSAVRGAVAGGRLFLFEITSYGLRQKQAGKAVNHLPTVHLLDAFAGKYDTVLCAGGTLYFRERSIKNPVGHKAGSILVNRYSSDGRRIPDEIHHNIYLYKNGRRAALTDEEREWLAVSVCRTAEYDIIKRRNYTADRFMLHLPVTLGASNPGSESKAGPVMNIMTDEWLKDNPRPKVLAINRGENNLLYGVLMDADGHILAQRHFNMMRNVNYRALIAERTKSVRATRDAWLEPDTVADLKEGYIAEAVHAIARMAFDNRAVIVLEDLDVPFKNSRTQLGQTVYRQFENKLLEKLRWYVPDKKAPHDVWQLAGGVKGSDKDNPRRNGIVWFVNPWGTSSMDPETGFVNMVPFYDAKKADDKRSLLGAFKDIRRKDKDYTFTLDYSVFGGENYGLKKKWSVSTAGIRLDVHKDGNGQRVTEEVVPSVLLREVLGKGKRFETFPYLEGEKLDNAVRALRFALQMRNCDIGAKLDWFISPVGGLDTRRGDESKPLSNDAVTAYNLGRKANYLIATGNKDIDRATWLEVAQK